MPEGQQLEVSAAVPLPTRPFTETFRGRQQESLPWALTVVGQRTLHREPLGKSVASRLKVIKGMPMLCLVLSHHAAPPDELIPYTSAVLSPLTCFCFAGYGYQCSPGGKRLPPGHQVFQAWKEQMTGGVVSRMCQ